MTNTKVRIHSKDENKCITSILLPLKLILPTDVNDCLCLLYILKNISIREKYESQQWSLTTQLIPSSPFACRDLVTSTKRQQIFDPLAWMVPRAPSYILSDRKFPTK